MENVSLQFDPVYQLIFFQGREIELTPLENKLMYCFVLHKNQRVTKLQLLEFLWKHEKNKENKRNHFDVCLHRFRKKLHETCSILPLVSVGKNQYEFQLKITCSYLNAHRA